jgi:hypothetical protein
MKDILKTYFLLFLNINPMYNPENELIEINDMYNHENEKYKEIDQTKIILLELIEINKKIQCSSMIIKDELKALYQELIELDEIKMELISLAQTQKKCDSQLQEYDSKLQELLEKKKIYNSITEISEKITLFEKKIINEKESLMCKKYGL